MPDWKSIATSHTLRVNRFGFKSGDEMDLTLHCRTLGVLNQAKDNAVLLLHGTTGSSLQFLRESMADVLFGKAQPLDCEEYFLILPDAIGHGESSKPSELGAKFPQYAYEDIVFAQHKVIQELFGLDSLRLILGTSMGGMNTWMWGYLYPDVPKALMPIACLPQRIVGNNLLFRRLMMAIIEADENFKRGSVGAPSLGVGFAWNLFEMMAKSPARLQSELTSPDIADKHIYKVIEKASVEHPLDVLWEFRASFDYDPADHLQEIAAPLLTVNFADDQLNSLGFPELRRTIAKVPRGRAVFIDGGEKAEGHQTLSKAEVWQSYVTELLAKTGE